MNSNDNSNGATCPVVHGGATSATLTEKVWWPKSLNLDILHQHDSKSDPLGKDFNYADAFKTLDLEAVKADLKTLMMLYLLEALELFCRILFFCNARI